MNRIILIGNGFDLAHGMKTSYANFLNDYWERAITEIQKRHHQHSFENDEFSISRSPVGLVTIKTYEELEKIVKNFGSKIEFKNKFLKTITEKNYIDSWVDVENEYYSLLKKAYKTQNKTPTHYKITELNLDFAKVKKLLSDYLKRIEADFIKNMGLPTLRIKNFIGNKIYRPFNLQDFSEQSLNQKAQQEYNYLKTDIEGLRKEDGGILMNELSEDKIKIISKIGIKEPLKEIKRLLQSSNAINYFDLVPDQTLFLNFNYTFTDSLYGRPQDFNQFNDKKYTQAEIVHIHGSNEKKDKNPIIFGFGDELDEDYKAIERLDDNRYLENIKSINYLETDNYKKLLEFANIGNFQIFILGHSCGISDRTLLNTLFEHENCASIKPFYHQRKENNDNYSDIVRNISRNFNDKAKMRDRVVNKTYCEPLC